MWNKLFSPMLLSEKNDPFDDENYLYEFKYDGIRALIYVSPQSIKIVSRNGVDLTNTYPELFVIKKIVTKKTILDGEIIALENNLPSFSKLQQRNRLKNNLEIKKASIINPVTYICFDILYEEKSLINLPLIERKVYLSKYYENDYFKISKYIIKKGKKLFKEIKKLNIEGIIAKKKDSKYYPNTRTKEWIKIKNYQVGSFTIGGFSYNDNSNVFSCYLGELKNNKLLFVGKVTIAKKNQLFKTLAHLKTSKNPFNNLSQNFIYVKPKINIKIKYLEKTKNNHLRQPIFLE
mgnify:CR=1 FL=1